MSHPESSLKRVFSRSFGGWNSVSWVLVVLSLLTVPLEASTRSASAPQQDQTESSIHPEGPFLFSNPPPPRVSAIHVLPPSPDDTPQECDASKKFHESCGPERYCADLSGGNHTTFWQDNHTTTYYCLHKALWFPSLTERDILAFLLTGTCCFLAAMAGIGGGGLILPILLLCCNFTPKEASVLSNTAVFCNTAGQFCVNNWNRTRRRNTIEDKSPLIYATVLMIMPGVIAGGSLAITFEGFVPSTAIMILALLTLLLASTKTYHKAQKMRAAESDLMEVLPTIPEDTMILSPARTNNLSLHRHPSEEEKTQDEALCASALEFGEAATPASKQSLPILNICASNSTDIMEETFFGSIRYLNREIPEDNVVNIIDESSLTASYSGAQSEAGTSISTIRAANDSGTRTEENSRPGVCTAVCVYLYRHKLQLLIVAFWVLDATTFLLLHHGDLVKKCSLGFFVLVGLPAVVAIIFVWLGRTHLLALRRNVNAGAENEEWQPLIATSFFQPFQDEDDDEEEAYEPVPNLEPRADGEARAQSRPSRERRSWVLLVPLISAFAGIARAFQQRPTHDRSARRRQESQTSIQLPDLSAPLLDEQYPADEGESPLAMTEHSFLSSNNVDEPPGDDENSIHDDYDSLLACWLPWAAVLIGLLSALLGIGGGELLGPILLLLLRMDPQQSSATTAIMSMMNSGTNLLHYMVADMMKAPGYAINLGVAGLIGGSGGRLQAMRMADSGRTSVIAMSLFLVLSLATALVAWELATTPVSWKSDGGIC